MKAKDLKPGDVFKIAYAPPDPESETRVCLANDPESGLRFGFPGRKGYWCYMGEHCVVDLVVDPDDLTVCEDCGAWINKTNGRHFTIEDGESPEPIPSCREN